MRYNSTGLISDKIMFVYELLSIEQHMCYFYRKHGA